MQPQIFEDVKAMQELIDVLPVAIFVKNASSEFQLMNKACEEQWGISFADLRETDGSQFFPPEMMERFLAKDREVFAGGCIVDFEEAFWNATLQQNRLGHTFKKPIYDASGNPLYVICVTIDITAGKQAEDALRLERDQNQRYLDTTSALMVALDKEGKITMINRVTQSLLGYAENELLGCNWFATCLPQPEGMEVTFPRFRKIMSGKVMSAEENENAILCRDGSQRVIAWRNTFLFDTNGKAIGTLSSGLDVTERKLAEEKLQLAALVYENCSEAMMITDGDNRILGINPAFTSTTGYTLKEVLGKSPSFLNSGRQDAAFYQSMWQAIKTGGHWQGEMWNRRKNGEIYAEWQSINTIFNADGSAHRHVALFSDITQKKVTEKLIWKQANFDSLTGLPNRSMFHDRLAQELKKAARANLPMALMFIDLDHFKEVNDTLGHDQGDQLLVEAARRIAECVRESDTVARLGGDEFTVILPMLEDVDSADRIAQNIIEKLKKSFVLGTENVFISASIGITLYPSDAGDIETLLKNADQAMYVAKNEGRNRFSYFTHALQEAAQTRMRLTNDLRTALANNQFRVYYQPIVEMATGEIHKAEALIRWIHPERGMVNPVQFIPLAEETGLINEIGNWVFHETANQVKHWRATHAPQFQISVNKSPVQFRQNNADCHANWLAHLAALSLHGQSISIEITEGLLLNAEGEIKDRLLAFRDAGMQVSIDDFGTGYSSLAYLKKFDIDYLKIDQSFVRNLENDTDDLALCEAIIVMAHKLGLKVIAEGVETKKQRDILALAGCDYAQGFLYSRAVPSEEFEVLLANSRNKALASPAH